MEDADGNAANLKHPALAAHAGHKVDGSPEEPAAPEPTPTPTPTPTPEPEPANGEPQFAGESATRSVDENAATGANVGDAITATDADGDALTYALRGSDAFAIVASSGQITVASALDYEAQSSYSLTVSVSDGRNAAGEADASVDDTIAVTVNVINVDEPGVASLDYEYDPPLVGHALKAVLLDPDGVVGEVAWTWTRSSDANTWNAIAGATGETYTATADDAGYYLRATASYADGHGPGKSAGAQTSGSVLAPPPEDSGEPQKLTVKKRWTSVLTVDQYSPEPAWFGCNNKNLLWANCKKKEALTKPKVNYGGSSIG